MSDVAVHNVRVGSSTELVDVLITNGRVTSIGPAPAGWSGRSVDGGGRLAMTGLVDGHAHVDKTLWGLPWRPNSAAPGLPGLIANEREGRKGLPPVVDRAGALLDHYIANGTNSDSHPR